MGAALKELQNILAEQNFEEGHFLHLREHGGKCLYVCSHHRNALDRKGTAGWLMNCVDGVYLNFSDDSKGPEVSDYSNTSA